MESYYDLYLDTSALLKLYIAEPYSEEVASAAKNAAVVYLSEIAELEARVNLCRARANGRLTEERLERILDALSADLDSSYTIVDYSSSLARRGGALSLFHGGLRAYDALHLASALSTFEGLESGGRYFVAPDQRFLAFDRHLVRAARRETTLYLDPFPEQDEG